MHREHDVDGQVEQRSQTADDVLDADGLHGHA